MLDCDPQKQKQVLAKIDQQEDTIALIEAKIAQLQD